jgi:hypothetical protein
MYKIFYILFCLLFISNLIFSNIEKEENQLLQDKNNTYNYTITTLPSFQVDFPMPTADKPQSKLWFTKGYWWTIIPRSTGPSLWQCKEEGWEEHSYINNTVKNPPSEKVAL